MSVFGVNVVTGPLMLLLVQCNRHDLLFLQWTAVVSVYTVELRWLEHLWDHRKLFETWVVRPTEGYLWCQVRKQMAII